MSQSCIGVSAGETSAQGAFGTRLHVEDKAQAWLTWLALVRSVQNEKQRSLILGVLRIEETLSKWHPSLSYHIVCFSKGLLCCCISQYIICILLSPQVLLSLSNIRIYYTSSGIEK